MGHGILVTGAAGFIGGSVLAEFASRNSGPVQEAKIFAAVRSEEQVPVLSKVAGVAVLHLDISNEEAVRNAVLSNEIDVIVHTASAINSVIVGGLIKALGELRKSTGKETYFIHSAIATLFTEEAGWPYGKITDTDPIYSREKELGTAHPVRKVSLLVTELAKEQGVKSFIVPVPQVYGTGTGQWRKLSVSIPAYIKASINHKVVYKFDRDGTPVSVHITDLAAFYVLLVESIIKGQTVPSGEDGYYFAISHVTHWWDVMQRLSELLYARGLVNEAKVETWANDEMASESLQFPLPFVRAMGTNSGDFVAVKAFELGWQPKWDEKRFIESLDDEIQAVLDLDTVEKSATYWQSA